MALPAFPHVALIDDFNRANEGPPPSASWSNYVGAGLLVDTNRVSTSDVSASDNGSYYNVRKYGPDIDVTALISTKGTRWFSLAVRLRQESDGTWSGLEILLDSSPVNSAVVFELYHNVYTQVQPQFPFTWATGDSFGVRLTGPVIQPYYKIGAGAWNPVGPSWISYVALEAGYCGLNIAQKNTFGDDFSVGTLPESLGRSDFDNFPKPKHRNAILLRQI